MLATDELQIERNASGDWERSVCQAFRYKIFKINNFLPGMTHCFQYQSFLAHPEGVSLPFGYLKQESEEPHQ